MPADLTDDDRATLAALLRDTIAADRFPLSPARSALEGDTRSVGGLERLREYANIGKRASV